MLGGGGKRLVYSVTGVWDSGCCSMELGAEVVVDVVAETADDAGARWRPR
jgi:hypothetical protein